KSASLPSKPLADVSSQRTVTVFEVMPTPSSGDQNGPSPRSYLPASSLTPQVMLSADAVAAPSPTAATQAASAARTLFTLPFLRDRSARRSGRTGRLPRRPVEFFGLGRLPLDQRFEGIHETAGAEAHRVVRRQTRLCLGLLDRPPRGVLVEQPRVQRH